ncbi:MAG: methyltransferase domain-containing protein [Oscillospiraceae bacterium]|nr:methyltransferase domain-containing protein [Oscillospiraceae bacterium]
MEWNAVLYDNKHDFVAEYGKDLLEFIPKDKKQVILDLGCGTGTLTAKLTDFCNQIIGVDSSQTMIAKARENLKNIENIKFQVCNALDLPFEQEFDVVFSNAVFHWIANHDMLLKNIYYALKPTGLLICEFGANGNIAIIENAFAKACKDFGYDYQSKFHFPTVENFRNLLENHKFMINKIYDFDRPTVLKDGQQGLNHWIKQFFASELKAIPETIQAMIIRKTEDLTRKKLWNGKEWIADYRRLRVIANK